MPAKRCSVEQIVVSCARLIVDRVQLLIWSRTSERACWPGLLQRAGLHDAVGGRRCLFKSCPRYSETAASGGRFVFTGLHVPVAGAVAETASDRPRPQRVGTATTTMLSR